MNFSHLIKFLIEYYYIELNSKIILRKSLKIIQKLYKKQNNNIIKKWIKLIITNSLITILVLPRNTQIKLIMILLEIFNKGEKN